ncbi:MAG: hypothetical protein H0V57_07390 [Thermoleophilaceae bacterium]|nr:hypothetical protein [Thermoleophilaceae bacterium]
MERFSIEVSRRRVKAGREATLPPAAGPCDFTNCNTPPPPVGGPSMRKSERNPELRRPQELSPFSGD